MSDVAPATDADLAFAREMAEDIPNSALARILASLDAANARIAEVERERDDARDDVKRLHSEKIGFVEEAIVEKIRAETAERKLAAAEAWKLSARQALCDAVACLGGFYSDRVPESVRKAILAAIDKTETSDD